jgi:asparagine synthase (glutamine-hydrolysing)
MLPALSRPPCKVAFSGGRDSSAILAIATYVARRHGLHDPIPLTFRYEEYPRTWEDEWQELMVRHLDIRDWEIVAIRAEFDVLGPTARDTLHRHGLFWPPNSYTMMPMFQAARGGSLLTGRGGDEVFHSLVKVKKMTPIQIVRSLRQLCAASPVEDSGSVPPRAPLSMAATCRQTRGAASFRGELGPIPNRQPPSPREAG